METLEPKDRSDLGQANIFVREYGDRIRYTPATRFLVYDGKVWNESETKAQGLSQDLTERQLSEAGAQVRAAQKQLLDAMKFGAADMIKAAKERLSDAMSYYSYAVKRRGSSAIAATLTEARPKVEIDVRGLDHDGFLLNTPAGTVDLRTRAIKKHDPNDYCTRMTAVAPDLKNADIYKEFLKAVTVNDSDLERFMQEVAGMCALGFVKTEALVLAYGSGGNGKSTLFNLWSRVLGDYAGSLSAEVLTANCRKNKSPELAELRGKRLIIAAELGEGQRMDTATLKKICSTDDIQAEKKYRDPFRFRPSHTAILYTNFLPKIDTNDSGTWDRILAVPFNANFRNTDGEVKDYCSHLFEKCGGAVLTWIIAGAKRYIENGYKIELPEVVKEAIAEYKESSDWFTQFIDECCEVGAFNVGAGELYQCYRNYCERSGEYCQAKSFFNQAREASGFQSRRSKDGVRVFGLRLKNEFVPTKKSWEYYTKTG